MNQLRSLPPTIPGRTPRVSQSRLGVLQIGDWLRTAAAEEIREAMPRSRKGMIPLVSAYGLSRARHGDDTNPLFRLACYFVELRDSGAPKEKAQRIVNWLQSLIDLLWGSDPADVNEASKAEQEHDGAEDAAQLAYHLGEPGARRLWLDLLRLHHTREATLIAALQAEEWREIADTMHRQAA